MRITGGARRGTRLATFGHRLIRPTTDRVREAIFNVLGQTLEGKNVLDLFAGTGAMAIEALSRGAHRAVVVDTSPRALNIIKQNLQICGYTDRTGILKKDALLAIKELSEKGQRFDIIFIDAPYEKKELTEKTLQQIAVVPLLSQGGIIVCESSKHHELKLPRGIVMIKQKRYGDTVVYFLEKEQQG